MSKISRFGIDNLKPGKPKTNREHLEEEVGDLLAMVDLMIEHNIIDTDSINAARAAKKDKLKKWSNIYS